MDLTAFADDVGATGAVTICGGGTRSGGVAGVRAVRAPSGIEWIQADEMIVSCGAATPVDELTAALGGVGQTVALPPGGTVGGALAVGQSDIRRLGHGPIRDVLLQAHYVSAAGDVVKAGGPTVKNVTGFDLCRLLVGSRGTLGFLGSVILRTRPLPGASAWFARDGDPWDLHRTLFRPTSVLWDGSRTWVLLEGDRLDVREQAAATGLAATDGPPPLPSGGRWSLPPGDVHTLSLTSGFVAEIGVGVVHHTAPAPLRPVSAGIRALHDRLKQEFDPTGRLNPGVDVLAL